MLFKEREFIEYLLLEKEVGRISDVCSNLSLSLKEVEELVQSVNNLLPHESIILVGDRIQVSEKCADELYAILIGNQQFFNDYDHNIELRRNMVEIYLMVHKSQKSLQTLSDKFYVSRNTMFADLKQIKGELKKLQLVVEYSRKKGYLVKGPEYLLRNRIVGTTRNLLKTFYGKSQLKKFTNTSDQELKSLRNMLTLIEEKTQIRLTDEQIEDLPYIFAVLMKRIRNYTDPWKFPMENYDIKNTVEYSLIKEQLNQFPFLKEGVSKA